WVVLGAWGFLQSAAHYADKWSKASFFVPYLFPFTVFDEYGGEASHEWAGPLVFVVAGSILVLIALLIARRRRTVIPAAQLLSPPRVHLDPSVRPRVWMASPSLLIT